MAFDKNHLKAQIEAGGGKVLDNFDIKQVCLFLKGSHRLEKYLNIKDCLEKSLNI